MISQKTIDNCLYFMATGLAIGLGVFVLATVFPWSSSSPPEPKAIESRLITADSTKHECDYCLVGLGDGMVPPSVDAQVEILAYLAFRGVPDERLEEILKVKTTRWDYPLYAARGLAAVELYARHHPNDGYE